MFIRAPTYYYCKWLLFIIILLIVVFFYSPKYFIWISWNVQRAVCLDDVCLYVHFRHRIWNQHYWHSEASMGLFFNGLHHILQAWSITPCFLVLLNGFKWTTAIPRVSGMTFSLRFMDFHFVDPSTYWQLGLFDQCKLKNKIGEKMCDL